jgi:hypothetical protein
MSHNESAVKHGRRQRILEVFRDADEAVLTTDEIANEIDDVSRETVREDLKDMRGTDLEGRETTQDYVWWVDRTTLDEGTDEDGVATGDELRRAVVDILTDRYDVRIVFLTLTLLALNSFVGVGIYLMLEFDIWLLPISETAAVLYTYVPMVTFGMILVVSGTTVVIRERLL